VTVHSIRTPLLEIGYEEAGPATGAAVLLLHGWPDSAITWRPVVPALADAGYRVIVPYLRGCGPTRFLDDTTMRSGQLSALGQDVIDFMNALGLERAALVGHDWGARAAAIATTELQPRHRVSHLVLMSVGYGTNDPSQSLPLQQIHNYWYHWYMALPRGAALVRDDRRGLTRYIWDQWGAPGWRLADEDFAEIAAAFDNADWAEVVIHSYRHRWGHAEGDARYDAIEQRLSPTPSVSVPTLVLHGAEDRCNDPQTSAGKERFFYGPYRRDLLPGVGHFPTREAPRETAAAIVNWLRATT
jgi:pimeloyl-ACP methyl ester carboxylesterase